MNWIKTNDRLPPESLLVSTKIDDEKGIRNIGTLQRIGNLWFIPSGKMYVYYTPTHWKYELERSYTAY